MIIETESTVKKSVAWLKACSKQLILTSVAERILLLFFECEDSTEIFEKLEPLYGAGRMKPFNYMLNFIILLIETIYLCVH